MQTLHISPLTKRNGLSLTLLGVVVSSTMIFILFYMEGQAHTGFIAALLGSLCCTLIGILKLSEPPVSLSLCRDCLQYHRKRGGWLLKWSNIQWIDQPRFSIGLESKLLPYVGIRIRNYDEFLTLITPWVAVRLLTEQRPLLLALLRLEGQLDEANTADQLFEPGDYRSDQGHHYHGAVAMLAHRMARLRILLGLDLLLPEESLDRPAADFLHLLCHYLHEARSEASQIK